MTRFPFMIGLIILLATVVFSGDNETPYVLVNGTSTIEVTPDVMIWSVTVTNKNRVLENAAEQNTSDTKIIIQLILDSGVEEKNIQTANLQFRENWEYKTDSRVRNGYLAITSITFKLSNLQKYRDLWIGLSRLSTASINSIQFDYSKRIECQNEARLKAILAAKEKAQNLAGALGSKIGAPLFIVEDLQAQELEEGDLASNTWSSSNSEEDEITESLAPGKILIQARVRVSFKLVTEKELTQ